MNPFPTGTGVAAFCGWWRSVFCAALVLAAVSGAAQVSLIPSGSVWKYLDNGSDQGTAWRALSFNDGTWAGGLAPLGFGDGDEATVVNSGPATNRFITTYFRRNFTWSGLPPLSNLVCRLLRDDGALVYLNNREVFRSNMPGGTINALTLASSAAGGMDESNNFYTAAVSPALLVAGPNIVAVEVHQNTNTSSDLSFDLEIFGTLTNAPPTVEITLPADGELVQTGAHRTVSATTSDADGIVARVEFFVDGLLRWRDTNAPHEFLLSDIAAGLHTLLAVAYDSAGAAVTSAPVHLTAMSQPGLVALVPNGSEWKYFDQGTDLGTDWRMPGYLDAAWPSGLGELGFGDSGDTPPRPERTLINAAARYTTYFRRAFVVDDPLLYQNPLLRLMRDDGSVVYLNGAEVFRSNMDPSAVILFNTPASGAAGDDGTNFFETSLPPFLLQPGTNLLAVEVHQNALTSSDLSFDLILLAVPAGAMPIVAPLTNRLVAIGGVLQLHAQADGEPPLSFQWQRNGVNLLDGARVLGANSPDLLIQPAVPQDSGDYTLIVSNRFGVAQAFANIKVVSQPVVMLQPVSQLASCGAQVTFKAAATECPTWQWFRNAVPLPGATSATLVLTNVQRPEVGIYWAVAANPAGLAQSAPAELQILLNRDGIVTNKLMAWDHLNSLPPGFAGFAPAAGGSVGTSLPLLHGVPLLFTTFGATKDPGEPNHCGIVGGHSKWAYYFSTRTEPLRVSTEGSDFDTVLAVYSWNGSDYSGLTFLACTNDSLGRLTSVGRVPATAGKTYYIAVDGVGGSIGTVRLQVGEGTLHSARIVPSSQFQFQMTGHGGRSYRLQTSPSMISNSANWSTVLTTSVPPALLDWVLLYQTNAAPLRRFYRGIEE